MSELQEIKSEKGVTVVKYGDHFLRIKDVEVSDEIDTDRITKIDLNNLIADIITTPVLINRWGNILAQAESDLSYKKLDFEIFCAKHKEEIRAKMIEDGKKPTISEVEDRLVLSAPYKIFKKKLIEAEKTREIVNSIFWSLKDKSNKLDKLSLTIQRDDLDTITSIVHNGIDILIKKPRIK